MFENEFSAEELVASLPPFDETYKWKTTDKPDFSIQGLHVPPTDFFDLNVTTSYNTNASEEGIEIQWYRHPPGVTSILCIAYSLVFVLGFLGNIFVVCVVLRSPRMRTVTNYFIVNLALADILVLLFCLPATLLSNVYYPWILGLFMCKSVSYLQGVSVSASINTLVAISIDRFVAICYPLRCQMTTTLARRVIGVIWVFSLLVYLPWAMYFELESVDYGNNVEMSYCQEQWPQDLSSKAYFFGANLVLCYALPLVIISVCYVCIWIKVWRRNIPGETQGTNADVVLQRSKLKVVKMMILVVALFAISWLPLYVLFSMVKLELTMDNSTQEMMSVMVPFAQWLGASNSCINPVLYAFFNKKFRKGFLAIIESGSCCGTLRYVPTHKGTKSTVLRSTVKSSRHETHSECVTSSQV